MDETLYAAARLPQGRECSASNRWTYSPRRELTPNGYSKDQIYEFLLGEVRMKRVRALIGANLAPSPAQVREFLKDQNMKIEASYVELKRSDFLKDITVTAEEVKKKYEDDPKQFMTPEERKVRFAAFRLPTPPEGKPFEESRRKQLIQQLAEKAWNLSEAMQKKGANFEEEAKKLGAAVGTTEFFEKDSPPKELGSGKDPNGSNYLAEAAFKLTEGKPYSPHLIPGDESDLEDCAFVLAWGERKRRHR
jgi:hypothetical protein